MLRDYFPGFLEAFQDRRPGCLAHPDARAILAIAPTPTEAARLTRPQLAAALKRAGRQRGITAACVRLQAIFRRTWLHQLPLVEQAMGQQTLALLMQLNAAAQAEDALAEATRAAFREHPDSAIFTSFPGLGELPAARVLAEIGDDRTRFADARGLKAYSGAAPVTRASDKKLVVLHRSVKNNRRAAVGYLWTFAAMPYPPVLELTTTGGGWPVIDMLQPDAICSAAFSAACTTASRPTSSLTGERAFGSQRALAA